jgi:hypothetical protein
VEKPSSHDSRNSKLIVKAHRTLISWADFVLKEGLNSMLPVDAWPEFQ